MTATLTVNGREWGGWKDVTVRRSIEEVASSFEVSASVRYPGDDDPVQISAGSAVTVTLDGERVITGWIDLASLSTTPEGREVTISGRSKTCDLVDCSAIREGGGWANRTVAQIAADVCRPFAIDVVAEADTGGPLPRARVQQGETCFDFLDRLARVRGLLLTDDALGRLVITRAGETVAASALTLPGNLLQSTITIDASRRFSAYTCKGQTAGDNNASGETVAAVTGAVTDTGVSRYRPIVLAPPSAVNREGAKVYARWEAVTRYGQSASYSGTVAGWFQSEGGPLWTPNQRVQVRDTSAGVDLAMLLVSADYSQGDNGTKTSMALAPVDGFALLALPARRRSGTATQKPAIGMWAELQGGVQ